MSSRTDAPATLYRLGSLGPEVARIQARLAELGFYAGALDGKFGGGTEAAVRAFQRAKRLAADGEVGPRTWGNLFGGDDIMPPAIAAEPLDFRCLALTASFETDAAPPECFAGLSGDFDGQGISFGVLQWNFGQGSLQPLLKALDGAPTSVLRTASRVSKLAVLMALAAWPLSAQQHECPGQGIRVAVGEQDLYDLSQNRRVPPGEFVALHGYPHGARLPAVVVRRTDRDSSFQLEVQATPDGCGWSARMPNLPPLARAEVVVTRYEPLTAAQRDSATAVFVRMLATVAEGLERGELLTELTLPAWSRAVANYLTERFPTQTTLARYRIPGGGNGEVGLAQRLVEALADADARTLINTLSDYADNVLELRTLLQNADAIRGLNAGLQRRVETLVEALGPAFFGDATVRRRTVAELMGHSPPPLPLDEATGAAIAALVNQTTSDTTTRRRYLTAVAALRVPLQERLRGVFAEVYVATAASVEISTTADPLRMGDLSRFGTVEFVTGQVLNGAKENLGFVTVSFFPTGPQARTPDGLNGRLGLVVGYSVTGGDTTNYLLAGASVRLNRYASVTAGWVARQNKGTFRCCFVGVAGDLTGIPFLSNLFVQAAKEER